VGVNCSNNFRHALLLNLMFHKKKEGALLISGSLLG
jgi:hypothetical protein